MRTFIFDLDGTLLNTMADIGSACNEILARHGYPRRSLPAYAHMVGNGFDILVRRALPQDRLPDAETLDSLTIEARQYYSEHMMEHTEPYPGMPQALTKLAEHGCNLAVLSNKPDAMSAQLIPHYFPDIPFVFVQGALPDVPLKPDPAGLLAMLAKMNTDKSDACYVGDSDVDMFTARNARVTGIGAGWGFRGPGELAGAGADRVLDEPLELVGLTSVSK